MRFCLDRSSLRAWVSSTLLPEKGEVQDFFRLWGMILFGGILLSPLTYRLPALGWDWYLFFTAHHPTYNLYSPESAYPPWTKYFVVALDWMPDWRQSLAVLLGISLVTIALATWRNGGKWTAIVLALLNPPVFYLLYLGHLEGLVLAGLLTGLVPLALVKPQLTIWSLLAERRTQAWTVIVLAVSLLIWRFWMLRLRQATFENMNAFGWQESGWGVLLLGMLLLVGAGKDSYCLMAAGMLVSPYLMPYNLAVLVPVMGKLRGWRLGLVYLTTWLVFLSVGLGGLGKLLALLFPICAYACSMTWQEYRANVSAVVGWLKCLPGKLLDARMARVVGRK